MNLRELLLQFAGEAEVAMNLDELLTTDVRCGNISILDDIGNGVHAVLVDESKKEETFKSIRRVLRENGYREVHILYDKGLLTIEV